MPRPEIGLQIGVIYIYITRHASTRYVCKYAWQHGAQRAIVGRSSVSCVGRPGPWLAGFLEPLEGSLNMSELCLATSTVGRIGLALKPG